MASPIRHVMTHVGDALFRVAPEREREFDTALNHFDLIYLPDRQWRLNANPKTREIFISRGVVELLWCASLAHYRFYTRTLVGKRFVAAGEIDLQADPQLRDAFALLRWSLHGQKTGDNADDWPTDLPQPSPGNPVESDENVASELALVAAGFFLHHEMAHLNAGHQAGVSAELSIEQEKEADNAALDWILDGVPVLTDGRFKKRLLGIANALLLTNALGLHGISSLGGNTHPFSPDRLASALRRTLGSEPHVATAFSWSVLSLHFQVSGRRLSVPESYDDFEAALDALCNGLAAELAR